MITEELQSQNFLKQTCTASPMPLEKQARDLSDKVFFDVQSLLQRSHHEAEENLATYQSLANSEISHMEQMITSLEEKNSTYIYENNVLQTTVMQLKNEKMTLQSQIERHCVDMRALQDNVQRIQLHHKNIQATHAAEMNLLKETLQRYKEKEETLCLNVQTEKQEKMRLLEESMQYQQKLQQQEYDKSSLQKEIVAIHATWTEKYTALQNEYDEFKLMNGKILDKIKEDFDDQLNCATESLLQDKLLTQQQAEHRIAALQADAQKQLVAMKNAHHDDKSALEAHYKQQFGKLNQSHLIEKSALQDRFKKVESLITLERENMKNKHLHAQKDVETKMATYKTIVKEKQDILAKLKSMEKQYEIQLNSDHAAREQKHQQVIAALNDTMIKNKKTFEKEISVLAQKKMTVEINMKQLHNELVACKRIISDLRKKQLNYTVVF